MSTAFQLRIIVPCSKFQVLIEVFLIGVFLREWMGCSFIIFKRLTSNFPLGIDTGVYRRCDFKTRGHIWEKVMNR